MKAPTSYVVTNPEWGEPVVVSAEDVRRQAEIFGLDPGLIREVNGRICFADEVVGEEVSR